MYEIKRMPGKENMNKRTIAKMDSELRLCNNQVNQLMGQVI